MSRYKTLYTRYTEEIESWDWAGIKQDALDNVEADSMFSDEQTGATFLGTVFGLFPSGKYYTAWAHGNVNYWESYRDAEFGRALDDVAESHGMYISSSSEGDPCDIFAYVALPENDESV